MRGRLVLPLVGLVRCATLLPDPASASERRSREVTREFQREHPCPSTGHTGGACPGYRKDGQILVAQRVAVFWSYVPAEPPH